METKKEKHILTGNRDILTVYALSSIASQKAMQIHPSCSQNATCVAPMCDTK